ncbi:MAG: hypothetical protein WC428_01345 [Candidatus Paceibacterota bacterium]
MIILESKLVRKDSPAHSEYQNYGYVDGYFLTIHDLAALVRDFQVDCFDGFVSNDHSYIEEWLKKHNQIVKK